jgi:ADP-ribosylglycohydrolase
MPGGPAHVAGMARARQSLEGLSVGDAFGEQLLRQPAQVFARLERREILEGPWPYTDDTVMALAIVESLERHGAIDQDWLAARFAHRWRLDPWRGYGGGAIAILSELARGADWRPVSRAAFGGAGSMGNGGAMRAAPVGAYFAGDLARAAEEARRSAEVTHAHAEGQAGAMAVAAAAAWIASAPADAAGLLDAVLGVTPGGATRERIAEAARLPGDRAIDDVIARLGNGRRVLAQDTVPFALWCARHFMEDYAGALWTVVSRLGDCDTLAAIVGGLVALHPRAVVPAEWRARRESLA